ncbi:MAG: hypothetical protein JSV78_14845 [Phycisphaerales bacterium]|nr:MAG: hypothetical protein JSV78_14845 [Phycisphaerales bacterium]
MADMPNTERKSHIPRWAKVIGLLLVLVFVLLGTIRILGLAATRRWERYVAKLEAEGQPITMEAIDALRTPLPDEQNGALVIEGICNELQKLKPESKYVFVLGTWAPDADFFNGVPRYAIEPTRAFLAEHAELLAQLERLADKPFGRFDLVLEENPWETLLPHLSPIRAACKLEHVVGITRLTKGDCEGAAHAAVLQFNIAGTLNEHPAIVARLVEVVGDVLAMQTVENTLRVGEPPEKVLLELQSTIAGRLDAATMRWAFQAERVFQSVILDMIASGKVPKEMSEVLGDFGSIPQSFLPNVLIRSSQLRGAEMMGWLVDAADDPEALLGAARRSDAELARLPKSQFLLKLYLPSLSRACVLHVKCIAQLRSTHTALAAERYRMQTGTLPESLDVLVPEYLAELPIDPFDGKPLRLVQTDEGIIIYSIGEDGIDDEGFVAEEETGRPGSDVGFRLNRLEHRGLILTDEKPPEEE